MQRTLTTSFRQDNNRPSMLPDKPVLSDGPSLPDWYVMMDRARLPDPSALVPHLPANSALIIRDPDPLVAAQMAVKLGEHCRRHGVLVLLSCPEPPQTLPCDGIHIPEKALARWRASDLQRLRPGLLTASAHSPGPSVAPHILAAMRLSYPRCSPRKAIRAALRWASADLPELSGNPPCRS